MILGVVHVYIYYDLIEKNSPPPKVLFFWDSPEAGEYCLSSF